MQYFQVLACQLIGDWYPSHRLDWGSPMDRPDKNPFRWFVDAENICGSGNLQKTLNVFLLRRDSECAGLLGQAAACRLRLRKKVRRASGDIEQFDVIVNRRPLIAKESRTEQGTWEVLVIRQANFKNCLAAGALNII